MGLENKVHLECDFCDKKAIHTDYGNQAKSIEDAIQTRDWNRIKITTPDFNTSQIGGIDKEVFICRKCRDDLVYTKLERLQMYLKKLFRNAL